MRWEWNVFYHDMNRRKITTFNIFEHGRFRNDVEKDLKEAKSKDEFAEQLKKELFYYFGSKAEWEIVFTSWSPYISMSELDRLNTERENHIKKWDKEPHSLYVEPSVFKKIDVRDQIINNYDIFVDYLWCSKTES